MSKETLNWLHPELLAISERVRELGEYDNRNSMLRSLVLDKALDLNIITTDEHKYLAIIARGRGK